MVNLLLLLFSSLILCLTLLYLKKKWPDLDVIDVYIIYVSLHFGLYPFIRSLYFAKGLVFDSFSSNPLVIAIVFLHLILIVIIIRVASAYLPAKVINYLKIKTLIQQWANVNTFILIAVYVLLIIFPIISYYKYGVKSHIVPTDYDRMERELPYWLMSMRTIYHHLALGVALALVSKAAMSEYRRRYVWISLIIILFPFIAYSGRIHFANIVVIGVIIWLVNNDKNIFRFKYLTIAVLMMISFFVVSNLYQTYRANLQKVGISLRELENPIIAALNFKATLKNLKERPGTWELNYLVVDKQRQGPGYTTKGKITREGLKGAIPRILWPEKKFTVTPKILADLYNVKMDVYNVGSNFFGIAQLEFGYLSIIIVPLTILLVIMMMAGLMKMTVNHPLFCWLFSVNILFYLISIEENGPEIFIMLRYTITVMAVFLSYVLINKILTTIRDPRYTS